MFYTVVHIIVSNTIKDLDLYSNIVGVKTAVITTSFNIILLNKFYRCFSVQSVDVNGKSRTCYVIHKRAKVLQNRTVYDYIKFCQTCEYTYKTGTSYH